MKTCTSLRVFSIVLVMALLFSAAAVAPSITVRAEGTSYYVDSVGGNDNNDGKSENSAWKSLDKVNATTFQPGDKILFKSGSSWNGQLWPKGSGTDGKPIVIDMYGEGNKPLFNGQGTVAAVVYLYNQEYWEIKNLEITNNADSTAARLAVMIVAEDIGICDYIHISGLNIHDVKGDNKNKETGGIGIIVNGSKTPTIFNDVLIEGCTIKNVDRTGIFTRGAWKNRGGIQGNAGDWYPYTKVVVKNNSLDSIGGDGICIRDSQSAIVEYNVASECNKRAGVVNVAIWPFNSDDTIMQYNEAYLTRTMNDGQGFDSDWNCNRTIIQYNYSHDNEGGFVLICCEGIVGAFNDKTIVRYNISQNDRGRTVELTGNTTNTLIYNNIFYIKNNYVDGIKPIQVYENIDSKDPNNKWSPKNTYWYNNIFFNEGMKGYEFGKSENNVFDYNCFYSDYGEYHYQQPKDAHKLRVNPQFVNPGSGKNGRSTVDGYKLKPTSPLIDKGMVIENNGGKDYWGNALYKRTPDIGAFEFQGEVPPKIKVNNKELKLKNTQELSGKILMAPADELSKALGGKYKYDSKKKQLTISKDKTTIVMTVGSKAATVNGKKVSMASIIKVNKVPYIPVQFTAEKLGFKYSYDSKAKVASIRK